jgi:hypothetical protein
MTNLSNTDPIKGIKVNLIWNPETDDTDPTYTGYWTTQPADPQSPLIYTFSIEVRDGNAVVTDVEAGYEFQDGELDATIESLELIRKVREIMTSTATLD